MSRISCFYFIIFSYWGGYGHPMATPLCLLCHSGVRVPALCASHTELATPRRRHHRRASQFITEQTSPQPTPNTDEGGTYVVTVTRRLTLHSHAGCPAYIKVHTHTPSQTE